MTLIQTFSDFSEKIQFNIPDFPLYVRTHDLAKFGYWGVCHWHTGVEFVIVLAGQMDFFVNGTVQHLNPEKHLFVNSQRMHYGFSRKQQNCQFIDLIVDPMLFNSESTSVSQALDQAFGLQAPDFLSLSSTNAISKNAVALVKQIRQLINDHNTSMLTLQATCMQLCANIAVELQGKNQQHISAQNNSDQAIWKMVDYIHRNFQKKITTLDIAGGAAMSRTKCFEAFKKSLNLTPNDYLTHFRLNQSTNLLSETHLPIKQISIQCGFSSVSYFCSIFKRYFGQTPLAYKNKHNLKNNKP
ncbi:MAG: AraC family transcriptional regulator [Oenococcus sp.]|uniref:AraC family transcriptional regulator n=1 Tax=Oenococcus sp. TaxID=1979414 RepID=UPI0039EA17B4